MLIFKLLRSKHWIKNIFIFLPSFFAGAFTISSVYSLIGAFFAFSFIASSIYIINDYRDIEMDKLHPEKRFRPLASGKVSKNKAILIFLIVLMLGVVCGAFISQKLLYILASYFFLNLFYTFILKRIAIIDLVCISIGFVLRIFAGSVVTETHISEWLVLMIFLNSLLMGFAKRRDDLLIKESNGRSLRKSIDGYNKTFVDLSIILMAGIVVVCYILYATHEEVVARIGSHNLYLTSGFVIIGILRYLQLTFVYEKSGSPTDILWHDKFLQITIFLWLVTFGFFLYV